MIILHEFLMLKRIQNKRIGNALILNSKLFILYSSIFIGKWVRRCEIDLSLRTISRHTEVICIEFWCGFHAMQHLEANKMDETCKLDKIMVWFWQKILCQVFMSHPSVSLQMVQKSSFLVALLIWCVEFSSQRFHVHSW